MRVNSLIVAAVALTLGASAIARQQVFEPGNGVTLPVVVKEVKPIYTAKAKEGKVRGTVTLKSVVLEDGTVGDVEVEQSLDEELDQQSINAMKQWVFKPGTKDGKPVAVRVHTEMTFTLR